MPTSRPPEPRVFVDADVLFAGAASPSEHSASLTVLRLAEITLIQAITSQQAVTEAERSLTIKLPTALPTFRLIVGRCLRVVPAPAPADLMPYLGLADPTDLPLLVAALREGCPWLVTLNLRHYRPGHPQVTVLRPGDLILRVRDRLAGLASEEIP
ncbi:MAG: PIN domain-containing protein [Caldilineales bacterium]|nr:PIN domain-containing protein [Caldilineales bacterium]MDW8319639.1 PIN domain-containing protein [Anaerolineae bacterium]